MSSGTLDNSLSQGDVIVNKESREKVTIEESKLNKKQVRRTKSFGGWTDLRKKQLLPDSKKTSSGVRLVWRRSSTVDLESLNKVLNIQTKTFKRARSPSPKPLPSTPTSHVFSESFDPLSVQRRVLTTSLNSETEDVTDFTDTSIKAGRKEKEKRQETSFKEIEMPSVKSLKSLFEKIAKGSNTSKKSTSSRSKRSLTVAGHELYQIHNLTNAKQQENSKTSEDSNKTTVTTKEQTVISKEDDTPTELKAEELETEVVKEVKDKKYSDHIDVEHLLTVKNLKHMFERSQSVPANLNDVTIQNKKRKPLSKSQSTKHYPVSFTPSVEPDCDQETEKKTVSGIKDEDIPKRTESVLSLRKKWESLVKFQKGNTLIKKEKRKDEKVKKTHEVQEVREDPAESKIVVKPVEDEGKETKNRLPSENEESQTVRNSVNQPTNELSMQEELTIERGCVRRSSVKDIAQVYEKRRDFKVKFHSAPCTPVIPKKAASNHETEVSYESASSSPITSIQMNRYPPSRSLRDLKKKFDFESEDGNRFLTKECEANENNTICNSFSSNMEMSIDSLERKASVKKLKKMYEPFQQHNRGSDINQTIPLPSPKRKSGIEDVYLLIKSKEKSNTCHENKNTPQTTKAKIDEKEITSELKISHNEGKKSERSEVKIELNDTTVIDIKTGKSEIDQSLNLENSEASPKTSKIERLVKEFVESEGLSTFLQVPQEEYLIPQSRVSDPDNVSDLSDLMNASTSSYLDISHSDLHCNPVSEDCSPPVPPPQTNKIAPSDHLSADKDGHSKAPSPSNVNSSFTKTTSLGITRSGSRELMPDELKYFQDLADSKETQGTNPGVIESRERSSTIESSSPTSTLSFNDLAKSKLRSSTRQFRDLHSDELRFFGANMNGTTSIKDSKGCSQTSIRQTTLERTLRSMSVDEAVDRRE